MTFYLLAFVVALGIFGLIRSQNARERLHLQSICIRSSEKILNSLRIYRQKLLEFLGLQDEYADIQYTDDYDDEPVIEEIPRSDSIEEFQGVRLRSNWSDFQVHPRAEEVVIVREETHATNGEDSDKRDKVLAAITDSLRRLSSAASSGMVNGAQLYDILLQETMIHDKTMRREGRLQAEGVDASPSAPEEEALRRQEPSLPGDDITVRKARMYFGQSPLEYTPHQK